MDKAALRELAEKANFLSPDGCVKLQPHTLIALLDEIQSLTEERTAWRTTAENVETELKAKYIDCQYAKDAGMTEYKCAGKCQYEALARAVMSDNTGKA